MAKFKTNNEKKAFRFGVFVGRKSKKNKLKVPTKTTVKVKPQYLGSTFVNGKFYDTNFKKPVEITKDNLKWIRTEYAGNSGVKLTDKQMVNSYVNHMRHKYGVFNADTGKFEGLLGDK